MAELYEKVRDTMSREQFDGEIRKKINEFGGLIDEEAAAFIILDENGRFEYRHDKISSIEIGHRVNIRARVKSISPVRTFSRKTGGTGEVVNLELDDGSGRVCLVLWDKDTDRVKTGKIRKNSIVRVINGLVKQGKYEIELDIGRGGVLIVT
jgi:ssDNA-binding replication factor A large subunit